MGSVANAMKDFGFLDIKTGIWFDHQINSRGLHEVDFSDNLAFNTNPDTGAPTAFTDRELHQSLDTVSTLPAGRRKAAGRAHDQPRYCAM